jgi:transcriptional regulator with XRE-family HTH domain
MKFTRKRRDMPQPSNSLYKNVHEFFASAPTVNQKAWGLINEFYHIILSYMEEQGISQAELAKRLGKSRSAISQMFAKTPNLTIKKMVEIADAVGLDVHIQPSQVSGQERQTQDRQETTYVLIPYQEFDKCRDNTE